MRIERIILKEIDPLKILTEKSLLPEREEEGESKEEEENEEDEKRRIVEIWNSMTLENKDSRPRPLLGLFHLEPDLADLATLLNRDDVQILLSDIITEGEKSDSPSEKKKISQRVKKNLQALNGKIARANSLWFRNLPLPIRVLRQIERIKIPLNKFTKS